MSLQVRLIDSSCELKTIKRSWDELYESIPPPHGHPFNCFSWLFPYAKLLEEQGSLLQIFTVFEGDKLVGIAPLQAPRRSLCGFRTIRFVGHLFSDYCDFVCHQNYEEIVVKELVRHWLSVFGNTTLFDLNRIHESSPTPSLLHNAVQEFGGQVYTIPWDKAPALHLTVENGKKTDILEKILSKKHCRQRIREMEKLGKARFLVMGSKNGLESHLERFFYYHRLRWHQKRIAVHSMNEAMQQAYAACICQTAREGYAAIFVLTIDDLPYAYAVALEKDRFCYYLTPVHNVFSRYSPGTALLYYIFRHMNDCGFRELDFTIGEEPYKTRFSNIVRQNRRVFFTFNASSMFAKAFRLVNYLRSTESLIEHTRSWRTKADQVSYRVGDYFSQRLALLKRLRSEGIKPALRARLAFSKASCLIYKLDSTKLPHFQGRENRFRIQRISVIQAIKFICRFHRCNSPTIWGDLLKRELDGDECYGTFIDNELIHTSWVTHQETVSISEIGDSLNLEGGECCVFDCNTLAEYRGRGVYPETLMYIAHQKKMADYKVLYIYTLSSNASSIRGIEKAGFDLTEIREKKVDGLSFLR